MVFDRLREHGCDVEEALKRFMGKRELYCQCLISFISDETMEEIEDAWFEEHAKPLADAVHRMKGISGNLGFTALYTIASDMTCLFRADKYDEAVEKMPQLREEYRNIISILRDYKEELEWTK